MPTRSTSRASPSWALIGGILVLALVGGVLWWAFCAWRDAREDQRELHAIVFAALVAMAVAFGIDWFWEILAMGSIFFIYAAVAISARCAQQAPAGAPASTGGGPPLGPDGGGPGRGLGLGGGAGPAAPGRTRNHRQPGRGGGGTTCQSAVDHAERARTIEPFAASPYVQLGLLAQLQGEYEAAISHFTNAIDREEDNWQWYYLRSKVEREAGDDAAAEADLEKARELNPLEPCLKSGDCG